MNNELPNDDVLFDRLVDGELSITERRALLESLESRPQGWRRCALAFLEAQSWQRDLKAWAANPLTGQVEAVEAEPQTVAVIAKSPAPTVSTKRITMRMAAQWMAMAASLLVAFRFGALQRNSMMPIANNTAQNGGQLASAPPTAGTATPSAAKPGDALNLWVRDDAGQMRRVRVPLVDAKALDQELGLTFQTGVPDDVRNRLQDNGYAVQSKHQYAPMWLDNGRPMIVPVEDTKIVPVSNKVY
jgi:hypothetical protein